jgi:hypothetical protein
MIPYVTSKFPPAPILTIALSAPGEGPQTGLASALIDTGLDFTLVPEKWLQNLDAPRSRPARVRGLWSAYQGDIVSYRYPSRYWLSPWD